MEAKVADTVDDANNGLGVEVTRSGMADNLTTDTIFLSSERESDEGDTVEVGEVTRERIEAMVANEMLHITQTKGMAFTRTAVFTWAKEPEECHVA